MTKSKTNKKPQAPTNPHFPSRAEFEAELATGAFTSKPTPPPAQRNTIQERIVLVCERDLSAGTAPKKLRCNEMRWITLRAFASFRKYLASLSFDIDGYGCSFPCIRRPANFVALLDRSQPPQDTETQEAIELVRAVAAKGLQVEFRVVDAAEVRGGYGY